MPFETFGEHLVRHGCTPMPFGAPAGAAAPAAGGFGGFADFSPGQVESDSSEESRTDESRVSASPPRCALSPEGPVSGHARVLAMDCGGSADMTAIDSAPADAGKSLLFVNVYERPGCCLRALSLATLMFYFALPRQLHITLCIQNNT